MKLDLESRPGSAMRAIILDDSLAGSRPWSLMWKISLREPFQSFLLANAVEIVLEGRTNRCEKRLKNNAKLNLLRISATV